MKPWLKGAIIGIVVLLIICIDTYVDCLTTGQIRLIGNTSTDICNPWGAFLIPDLIVWELLPPREAIAFMGSHPIIQATVHLAVAAIVGGLIGWIVGKIREWKKRWHK